MIGRPISELQVGNRAEMVRLVTQVVIAEYVDAVHDCNPIHSDSTFAAKTSFGKLIAPGLWTAGLISGVIGGKLPGPGSLYVSQQLSFLKPVLMGDTITARVEVAEVIPERNRVRLKTICVNQRGEEVLSGEAWVKPPKTRIVYADPATEPQIPFDLPWFWGAAAVRAWGTMARSILQTWRGPCGARGASGTEG